MVFLWPTVSTFLFHHLSGWADSLIWRCNDRAGRGLDSCPATTPDTSALQGLTRDRALMLRGADTDIWSPVMMMSSAGFLQAEQTSLCFLCKDFINIRHSASAHIYTAGTFILRQVSHIHHVCASLIVSPTRDMKLIWARYLRQTRLAK